MTVCKPCGGNLAFYLYSRLLAKLPPDLADQYEFQLAEKVARHGADKICDALSRDLMERLGSERGDYMTTGERIDLRTLYAMLQSAAQFVGRVIDDEGCDAVDATYIAYRKAVSHLFPVSREAVAKFLGKAS